MTYYLISYLFGSIPFGWIIAYIKNKKDIRDFGSGSIGATNILRFSNRYLASITLILDLLKGAMPILLFYKTPKISHELIIISSTVGHIFPIWLRFKGGKGVATSIGGLLAYQPLLGSILTLIWILIMVRTGISSLASLITFSIGGVLVYYTISNLFFVMILILLLFWSHRSNLKRIINGKEYPVKF